MTSTSARLWKKKDSTLIPVRSMTDSHLRNTIKLLRRAHDDMVANAYAFAASLQGDMATYYADQACDDIVNEGIEGFFPDNWKYATYDTLIEEVKRRIRLRKKVLYP